MFLDCARADHITEDSRSKILQTDVLGHLVGSLQHSNGGVRESSVNMITALVQFGNLIYFRLCKG